MMGINDSYVHVVRLALEGRQQDVLTLVKRNIKQFDSTYPELTKQLRAELSNYQSKSALVRKKTQDPLPIDLDSKLELAKRNFVTFEKDFLWPEQVEKELKITIKERELAEELINNGLSPTRSLLFVGEPGVGKTMAAKWLAYKLNRPIVTLDLATVMSSFLGKTGNNIRAVLEYAKKNQCVLLLDEFDAIAKKRGDDSEVGELKRLVTVLLQEIDEWPDTGLLIAATNHGELLDSAVWRRFDRIINFPKPSAKDLRYTINNLLENYHFGSKENITEILSILMEGMSYSDFTKKIVNARKESVLSQKSIELVLENTIAELCSRLEKDEKIKIALKFLDSGYSQRRTAEIIGMSRDTIRKYMNHKI